MKLTIIPIDGAVYKDNQSFLSLSWSGTPSNVHALQWQDTSGWIEFNDGTPNQDISELPDWANNAVTAWDNADYAEKNPPAPTPEQIQAKNKAIAVSLLSQTDWATISDVTDPAKSNPYLSNGNDFLVFRNKVRFIAISPPTVPFDFPPIPSAEWLS